MFRQRVRCGIHIDVKLAKRNILKNISFLLKTEIKITERKREGKETKK